MPERTIDTITVHCRSTVKRRIHHPQSKEKLWRLIAGQDMLSEDALLSKALKVAQKKLDEMEILHQVLKRDTLLHCRIMVSAKTPENSDPN